MADFHAHDNVIKLKKGQVGVPRGLSRVYGAHNRFESNHYYVDDLEARWWRWAEVDNTWSEWQSHGHDVNGSLERLAPRRD